MGSLQGLLAGNQGAAEGGENADACTVDTTAEPVMDRAARVLRYKEKKLNRKFVKTIRCAPTQSAVAKGGEMRQWEAGASIAPLWGLRAPR